MLSTVFFLIFLTYSNTGNVKGSNCDELWIDCGNDKCVPQMWVCDGQNDCGNLKDEENCDSGIPQRACLSSQFQCVEDGHCIADIWHCDGEHDCEDGSDEKNCLNDTHCHGFRCNDNHCIPETWKCDGHPDCDDGSDEGDQCPKSDVCAESLCSQKCRRTPKGPECYCNDGYMLDRDNKTCTDIDECRTEGTCSQICTNLIGSYKCSCIDGYALDNTTCRAIASLKPCKQEIRRSGGITMTAEDDARFEECIDINVPPNQFIRLKIQELVLYTSNCQANKLEIITTESADIYSFCLNDNIKNSITAVTDVRVHFIGHRVAKYDSYFDISSYSYPKFKLNFEIRDIECLRNNSFHCSTYSCISKNEVCDGVKDCENGADEVGCETGILGIKGVAEARSKEITWIKSKRSSSWGWHEHTPRVLFSLFLSGGVTFNGTNSDEELMAKQTELKTSIALLKNPLSAEHLSMFINSLLVTCHNPRQFYGQNLIKRLKDQIQSTTNFTHPIAYLTLCNAKESWPLKTTTDLNKILSTDADYPFVRDYQAFAVMAVSCYENQTKLLNKAEHSTLKTNYERVLKLFKETQLSDGSFGNLHTTSLIAQALISSGQEYEKDWKLNATVHYLLEQLASPHDVVASSLTLPVLNAKSMSDISKVNCTLNPRRNGYDNQTSKLNDYIGPKMRVQYSLFVGDEKDVIHTISLRVPENYTAYEVMKLAETEDPKYTFKYKKISGMMYVYQIGEMINDPEAGYFWMLYQGQDDLNATLNHYNLSPDQLVMQNKEHLALWYKKAHF